MTRFTSAELEIAGGEIVHVDVVQGHRIVGIVGDDGVGSDLGHGAVDGRIVGKQDVIEHDHVLAGVEAVDGVAVADACRQKVNIPRQSRGL